MNQIDVVTTFQNIEIDDDNIYMTPPGGWPESPTQQWLSSHSGNMMNVLNVLCGYRTMGSIPIHSLLYSVHPLPILTSIFALIALSFLCTWLISLHHIRWLLPQLWSMSKWQSQRYTRWRTLAWNTNSSASRSPAMVWGQSQTASSYHHNFKTIWHGAHSQFFDAHESQCVIALGQGSEGEAIRIYHRLPTCHGITNVCSICNTAR